MSHRAHSMWSHLQVTRFSSKFPECSVTAQFLPRAAWKHKATLSEEGVDNEGRKNPGFLFVGVFWLLSLHCNH